MPSPKLIVIRGNSGSGKGTIAKLLRARSARKIALVEQDYLRRTILNEKEKLAPEKVIGLIRQTVTFCLEQGYDVVLDGILSMQRYREMLEQLKDQWPDHHFFYLDVSFEETLRRHATKPNAHEFGEEKMRGWYEAHDITGFPGEVVIPETVSAEDAATIIAERAGLMEVTVA